MGTLRQRLRGRRGLPLCIAAIGALALPAPALASFHLMSIREVFPGSTTHSGQDYVELQMYASGQNFVGGKALTVYAANGSVADTATFPPAPGGNLPNGPNQQTILIGAASSVVGVTPDLVDSGLTALKGSGGAVCWASTIDCVSWGSFSGTLPSPAGNRAPAISDGDALRRSIAPGCSTLLEASDDTDDSATDFALTATPKPRNDSTTPTEKACPDTTIDSGPSGSTTDRTPTFQFHSPGHPGATFKCKLDGSAFTACSSPDTLARLALGRHTFQVEAILNGAKDPTPAKRSFRVVKP